MKGYLGWDVGAWHCQGGSSRDALAFLVDTDGTPSLHGRLWRGNLLNTFNSRAKGAELLRILLELVVAADQPWTSITLGIDTPLGWPEAFHALLAGSAPEVLPTSKARNPLLMRTTERWLAERRDLAPLSAVQDLIGSQSTKGLAFLHALGLETSEPGVWNGELEGIQVTAIEAYPAACHGSVVVAGQRSALPQQGQGEHQDIQDALTCAIVARLFATDREALAKPAQDISVREGWIWVPSDNLRELQPNR
jgi:hypothetical protein